MIGHTHAFSGPDTSGAFSGYDASTGPELSANRSNVIFRTRFWNSGSLGTPKGRPSSKGTQSALGGRMAAVCS